MIRRRQLLLALVPLMGMATTEGYLSPLSQRTKLRNGSTLWQPEPGRSIPLCAKKNEDEDIDKKKGSKAGDLLRWVGSFLPFSSDESKQKKEPEKEEEQGGFLNLFRRNGDKDENAKTDSKEAAKKSGSKSFTDALGSAKDFVTFQTSDNSKEKQPKDQDKKRTKPKDQGKKRTKPKTVMADKKPKLSGEGDDSGSFSALRRVQDFLWFNSTSDEREAGKKQSEVKSSNPLSVVQKFAGSIRKSDPFSKNANKEKWYPVFPKTRIMPGEMVPVTVAGLDLLVIASIDGRSLYCIANSCPHLGTPLETGKLTRLPTEIKLPALETTTTDIFGAPQDSAGLLLSETDISNILSQDGCEDCIVCPLHRTAFALKSGEVRGEWCPYPPILGAIMGTVKAPTSAAVFDVRTQGKNVEVRLNSVLTDPVDPKKKQ